MSSVIRRFSHAVRGKDKDGQEKKSKRKSTPNGLSMANGKPQPDGWPLKEEEANGTANDGMFVTPTTRDLATI